MTNQDIIQIAKLADASLDIYGKNKTLEGEALDQAWQDWIKVSEAAVASMGASPEMQYLQAAFGLSKEVLAVIALVALPQLNSRYSDLYFTLSGDKDKLPTLNMVADLVAVTFETKTKLLLDLGKESPLFYWKYLTSQAAELTATSPLMGSQILINFISGSSNETPNDLLSLCTSSPLNLSVDAKITALNSQFQIISGGFEERQLSLAVRFAVTYYQRPLYRINISVLMARLIPAEALNEALAVLTLMKGILYWQNALQDLKQNPGLVPQIKNWLSNEKNFILAGEVEVIDLPPSLEPHKTGTIQLTALTRAQEKEVWEQRGAALLGTTSINWDTVNNSYTMNMARIEQTLLRLRQGQDAGKNSTTDMLQTCYVASSPAQLAGVGYLDTSQHTFSDMVLNDDSKKQLDALQQAFLNRVTANAKPCAGVLSIFKGSAGNGKTMAAECLANALKLPIYRIDYSILEKKSEASLASLFDEAQINSAALVFDEADALFSSKKNSSDLILAFLIQRIGSYGGLVILTTNADQNIDPAFFRRAVNVVNFPVLNSAQRLALFQKLFLEKGAQVDSKIDLASIASTIRMSGRSISNIVKASVVNALAANPNAKPLIISSDNFSSAIKQEVKE